MLPSINLLTYPVSDGVGGLSLAGSKKQKRGKSPFLLNFWNKYFKIMIFIVGGKAIRKKVHCEVPRSIKVSTLVRGKKKHVTLIVGLKTFGMDFMIYASLIWLFKMYCRCVYMNTFMYTCVIHAYIYAYT